MATTPIANLVVGTKVWQDAGGIHIVQPYLVTGLTATTNGGTPLLQALFATGLPAYGSAHPDDGTLVVKRIEPVPHATNSRTDARVTVEWGVPDGNNLSSVITRYASVGQEYHTNFDDEGDVIDVDFTDPNTGITFVTERGLVTGRNSRGELIYDLIVADDPESFTDLQNGVNDSGFRGRPRFTWCCDAVDIEKAKYVPGFHLQIRLTYDPKTHLRTAFYRDPHGFIPAGIDTPVITNEITFANGWSTVIPHGLHVDSFGILNDLPTSF